MSITASIGIGSAPDGRTATTLAFQQAMQPSPPGNTFLALIFCHPDFLPEDILAGASASGSCPLIGGSCTGIFGTLGNGERAVLVILLHSDEISAKAAWLPNLATTPGALSTLLANLQPDSEPENLILTVAEGFTANASILPATRNPQPAAVGWLAANTIQRGYSTQIGGTAAGRGGLAAAVVQGDLKIGFGSAHGWFSTGNKAQITQAEGPWLRELNELPAMQVFSAWFDMDAQEWTFPPLDEFVRQYPLGIQNNTQESQLEIYPPLRATEDGYLRFHTSIPENQEIQLLIASQESCLQAAQKAAQLAGDDFPAEAKPVVALALVDAAWKPLLSANPDALTQRLGQVLGSDLPICGAYVFGQFTQPPGKFFGGHISIILLG